LSSTQQKLEYKFQKVMTVKEILDTLHLKVQYFAVLVNGSVVGLNDRIEAGQTIIVLPKIAGG
jgi:sulfur carrier protein ThiS